MEIRLLRMFREVVDAGSISEAARRMNMSQPPLSHHMKMLEQELQTTLFRRGKKNIELTGAGKLLYERAETILALERTISREIAEAGVRRTLRIGVTPTTSPLLISALTALHQSDRNLCYEVFDGSSFELRGMLEKGLLDCTLLRSPIRLDGFDARPLCREPFLAAGNPDGFRAEDEITLRQLSEYPLILYRRYESYLSSAFHDRNISCSVRAVCDDARTALAMAQANIGIAVLPRSVSPLLQGTRNCIIADKSLETEILFVRRKGQQPSPEIIRLLDLLEAAAR